MSDVFDAVQSSSVYYGVVPFENSTNGSVLYTLDLFADRQSQYPDVYVCGEAYLDVHHCLLGYASGHCLEERSISGDATPTRKQPSPTKPRTQPIRDLQHIKRIYSHPQAFGQCEVFLSTFLKGVERQEVSSTSKAAEIVSQDSTRSTAAISSKVAAGVHGLDVLAQGIEDRDDNTTRFFFIRNGTRPEDPTKQLSWQRETDAQAWKTLVAFTINHNSAGALADALMVFKTYVLNLTSINSRPSRINPWHYIFFIEFGGRKEEDGKGNVAEALKHLATVTEGCRWHGSWIDRVKR